MIEFTRRTTNAFYRLCISELPPGIFRRHDHLWSRRARDDYYYYYCALLFARPIE